MSMNLARDIFLVDKKAYSLKEAQQIANKQAEGFYKWPKAHGFNDDQKDYDWDAIERDYARDTLSGQLLEKESHVVRNLFWTVKHRQTDYWIFLLSD